MAEHPVDYWRRKSTERAERRQAVAPRDLGMAVPEPSPTRSFGFQSGAARVNEGREKNLAAAGAELGAPTSWAAGEGAPQPVEVVRGMKTTYTNPAPYSEGGYNPTASRNTQEFATATQAKQAFNRGLDQTGGYGGEYVPPEGPKIEALGEQQQKTMAAENKRPDLVEAAEATKARRLTDEHVGALSNYLTNTYGKQDPTTGRMVFKPANETMARDAMAAEEVARQEARRGGDGGKAAIAHFQDRQNIRAFLAKSGQLPQGVDPNDFLSRAAQDPKVWADLVERGRILRTTTRPQVRKPWFEQMAESSEYGVGP